VRIIAPRNTSHKQVAKSPFHPALQYPGGGGGGGEGTKAIETIISVIDIQLVFKTWTFRCMYKKLKLSCETYPHIDELNAV